MVSSTTDATYWLSLTNDNYSMQWSQLTVENGILTVSTQLTPPPLINGLSDPSTYTRFTDLVISEPNNDKDIQFDVSYFLNELEIDCNNTATCPTQVSISFAKRPDTTFVRYSFEIDETVFGTSTTQITVTDNNLSNDAIYDVLIEFYAPSVLFGASPPFAEVYIYTFIELDGSHLVDVGTSEFYNGIVSFDQNNFQANCGITDLLGCFQGVLYWFFVPTWGIEYFELTAEELKQKIPFSYVFAVQDQVETMSQGVGILPILSVQLNPEFPSITLLNPAWFNQQPWLSLFAFVRTISTIIIYVTLVLVLYRRSRQWVGSLVGSHLSYEVFRKR